MYSSMRWVPPEGDGKSCATRDRGADQRGSRRVRISVYRCLVYHDEGLPRPGPGYLKNRIYQRSKDLGPY